MLLRQIVWDLVRQTLILLEEGAFVMKINVSFNKSIGCTNLDPDCLTCSSSTLCTSCNNGKLRHGASCVVTCPSGTYNNGGICTGSLFWFLSLMLACSTLNSFCTTCTSSSSCTSCSGNRFGYGSDCRVSCPANTYNNGIICIGIK